MLSDSDSEMDPIPFQGIEKAAVLQSCKEFSNLNVDTTKCAETMCSVLYLMATGVSLSEMEATDIFFGATKLFQCDSPRLRRLLYVFLKEVAGSACEQVFIASSSLVNDINSNDDVSKANAIRTLRKVTDATMIGPMERYLKQAVVDSNSDVVSSALVTGLHLSKESPEMVRRWGAEVAEALKTRGNKVQYHALALLNKIRKSDRVSVMRLVEQARNGPIRSPLALCLLIKQATELMREDFANSLDLYKFVTNMTHHSSDMVVLEASKAICSLTNVTAKEVTPAVLVLQLFLTSHRPVLRFAAVRLLSRVANVHPTVVTSCNLDLENMLSDSNRAISTFAVTTLLKSGSEFNAERVLKQISTQMADLNDDFLAVIIDAVKAVCRKFPDKYIMILQFLSECLREDGRSPELKRTILETMIGVVREFPAAKEAGLSYLCEYIEDCDFNVLVQRVLYLLAEEGPTTSAPHRYIRYVNNRIALEAAPVRATAVSTLAKFAARCPDLRGRVLVLLKRATTDPDDEVRDRAVLYHKVLSSGDEYIIKSLLLDVAAAVHRERESVAPAQTAMAAAAADTVAAQAAPVVAAPVVPEGQVSGAQVSSQVLQMRDEMRRIPNLRDLGEPARSSEPSPLTEADNEFVVAVVKHVYAGHVVFQFRVQNTMEGVTMRNTIIRSDVSEMEELEPVFAVPSESIAPGCSGYIYEAFARPEGTFPAGSAQNGISFAMQEDGDDEFGDPEEFPMDEFALNVSDYITPQDVGDFDGKWAQLEAGGESMDTYDLGAGRTLTQAAHELIDFYGMFVVGGRPEKIQEKSRVVQMSGLISCGDEAELVLIACKTFITAQQTVALQLGIRGASQELREFLSLALVS